MSTRKGVTAKPRFPRGAGAFFCSMSAAVGRAWARVIAAPGPGDRMSHSIRLVRNNFNSIQEWTRSAEDSGPSSYRRDGSTCDGGTPLGDGAGPLAHRGEAVTCRAEEICEPIAPMVGQRQGNLGNQDDVNSRFHAETVPTRLDLIASHRKSFSLEVGRQILVSHEDNGRCPKPGVFGAGVLRRVR
jgi:hypothetical protein